MDAIALIDKYYADTPRLRELLWIHSRQVADRCLKIAVLHPELGLDKAFLEEAALLHDIGILHTHAPGILCTGDAPYICHGYLGAEMLRAEGFPPVQDYYPETLEEQLICYADKFYSKSHPDGEKTPEQALKSVSKYGEDGARRFRHWMELFTENLGH